MQDYLQRFEPRQLLLILSGIVLLFAAVLITYVVKPQFKNYSSTLKSRDSLKQVVDNNRGLEIQLKMEQKAIAELNKKLHGDMANLPVNQMESFIIGRLQHISWQHNIELIGIKPSTGEKLEKYQEILFNVNLSGDYFDLYTWIKELSNELGFTVIKQFEMRPQQQNKVSPRLSANLTMASYRSIQ